MGTRFSDGERDFSLQELPDSEVSEVPSDGDPRWLPVEFEHEFEGSSTIASHAISGLVERVTMRLIIDTDLLVTTANSGTMSSDTDRRKGSTRRCSVVSITDCCAMKV